MFIAYDISLQLMKSLRSILDRLQRRDDNLAKQARKAATSITLNLAEGNRRTGKDRAHHFRIAAGSANEVRAALDIAESWGYLRAEELADSRALLDRQLAILWRLAHPRA